MVLSNAIKELLIIVLIVMSVGLPEETVALPLEEESVNDTPTGITLIALKEERHLEVWYENNETKWLHRTYPILGASGVAGPKLKQGDRQVPEGIYKIVSVNLQSQYRLSMLLNYPNAYDVKKAKEEGRTNLGGEITIHGGTTSRGCIAIGEVVEDLYEDVLAMGFENVEVIILPYDFRVKPYSTGTAQGWSDELYMLLQDHVKDYETK